jgi:hypothetical protein
MGDKAAKYPFFARHAETIVANGFSVVAVVPATKRPRYKKWHAACFKDTLPAFLSRHVKAFPEDSIGIACGAKVVAIDIDETDLARANEIHRVAVEILGDTPLVRFGQFPKRTLVYRAAAPIDSIKLGKVEVLANGRKFVAFGIHPATKKPYHWPDDSPADTDLQSLPAVDKRRVERFLGLLAPPRQGKVKVATPLRKPNLPEAVCQILKDRIVRDENGRVIDGREAYLTQLTWEEYQKGHRDIDVLTSRVWMRFSSGADLSRPKENSPRARYSPKDARAKAKLIIRKAPAQVKRAIRQGNPELHFHSMRQPEFWTAERKQCHQAEASYRRLAPSRLRVNQAMLDAVPAEIGQCGATVKDLMRSTGLSVSAVKSSRRDLVQEGFWVVERSVYIPSMLDLSWAQSDEGEVMSQAA